MKIRKALKNSDTLYGIYKDIKKIKIFYFLFKRQSLIKKYFTENKIKKLHLGSNISLLDGWLCSDLVPQNTNSIFLDVTKKFPFKDNSFDYIYSEHLIEHLNQESGMKMLKECFRVLNTGGRIRIATPDLEQLLKLYAEKDKAYGSDYIKWSMDNFSENYCGYSSVVVINTLFHNWWHQFLYDFDFLKLSLLNCDFKEIERSSMMKSNYSNLQNIEQHHLNIGNYEMIEFETLIIEAQK